MKYLILSLLISSSGFAILPAKEARQKTQATCINDLQVSMERGVKQEIINGNFCAYSKFGSLCTTEELNSLIVKYIRFGYNAYFYESTMGRTFSVCWDDPR